MTSRRAPVTLVALAVLVVGAPVAHAAGDDEPDDAEPGWRWDGSGVVKGLPTTAEFVGPCLMGVQPEDQPLGVTIGGRAGGPIATRTLLVVQVEVCVGLSPVVLTATPAVRHFITDRIWLMGGLGANLVRSDPDPGMAPFVAAPDELIFDAGFSVLAAAGVLFEWRDAGKLVGVEVHIVAGIEGGSVTLAIGLEQ